MQSDLARTVATRGEATPRRALVLGGTGTVGSAVLAELAAAEVPTVFSYRHSEERARALAAEHGQRALRVDLENPQAMGELKQTLARGGQEPHVVIHCAVTSSTRALAAVTLGDWQHTLTVNSYSALSLCQHFSPYMAEQGGGDLVFVGALDRSQSLPTPAHFAASQGALSAMAMALGKELGPNNIRVNMVALGPLERGLSQAIAPELLNDFTNFSALGRLGTPREAARAIVWLALENRYMNGQVVPVNGGL